MIRRVSIVLATAALVALVAGSTVMAAPTSRGHTLVVVERATSDTVVDLAAAGDTIGDLLAFGNDIFDGSNATKIGRDEGSCIRSNPGLAWECTWTTIVPGGSLTVQGPFYDDLRDSELAITGGTGEYWNTRGQMTLHARNAGGTEFDFVFHLVQ
ncbi:MAG: dirigent protein [Chloroflexota bacterium]